MELDRDFFSAYKYTMYEVGEEETGKTYVWLDPERLVVEQCADDIEKDLQQLPVVLILGTILECRDDSFADPLREVGQQGRETCIVPQAGERSCPFWLV